MTSTGSNRELKSVGYEVFIVLLSLLAVFNMGFGWIVTLGPLEGGPALDVVLIIDVIITPIFLFDFFYRLATSHPKRAYFIDRQGWADLLACIPMFRIFRAFRVIRVVRLLRTYGVRNFVADLYRARAQATFLLTMFLVILVVEVAGATIFYVENGREGANIASGSDAIWWSLVTITTVGYGDRYPVSNAGRIIGAFLLFAGIGLFSVLTGFIANVFLAPGEEGAAATPEPAADDPRAAIRAVERLLAEQEARAEEIRRQLAVLEAAIPVAGTRDGTPGPAPAA